MPRPACDGSIAISPIWQEARDAALRMVEDTMRAAEIIDRMNSLNKKAAPQREPINVNEVINEIVALLRNEAARHGISIRSRAWRRHPRRIRRSRPAAAGSHEPDD